MPPAGLAPAQAGLENRGPSDWATGAIQRGRPGGIRTHNLLVPSQVGSAGFPYGPMVRPRGVAPPRADAHQALNLARLRIPPRPREGSPTEDPPLVLLDVSEASYFQTRRGESGESRDPDRGFS